MKQPLVSCIMPTANRQKFIPFAVNYFLNQTYPNKELIIIDDGKESILPLLPDDLQIKFFYTTPLGSIGLKRNYACEKATGEIILHWDDDDWYANDWITKQVDFLIESGADICGIENPNFYSVEKDTFWVGTSKNRNNPSSSKPILNGATLAYWKKTWQKYPFKDLQIEEEKDFIRNSETKIFAHDYINGFAAVLHYYNTTTKYFEGPIMKHSKI